MSVYRFCRLPVSGQSHLILPCFSAETLNQEAKSVLETVKNPRKPANLDAIALLPV
jgi:hypothetical protein